LLSIDKFGDEYREFFNWFENAYPDTQVYFLHFSTKLDQREEFKIRALEIKRVMIQIEKEKKYIHNIFLEDELVVPMENNDFPYHYNDSTYEEYLKELKKVMNIANYSA